VADRKQVKEAVQFLFGAERQQFVYLPDVLGLRREALLYIENQRL
jgi:hypothetical protein